MVNLLSVRSRQPEKYLTCETALTELMRVVSGQRGLLRFKKEEVQADISENWLYFSLKENRFALKLDWIESRFEYFLLLADLYQQLLNFNSDISLSEPFSFENSGVGSYHFETFKTDEVESDKDRLSSDGVVKLKVVFDPDNSTKFSSERTAFSVINETVTDRLQLFTYNNNLNASKQELNNGVIFSSIMNCWYPVLFYIEKQKLIIKLKDVMEREDYEKIRAGLTIELGQMELSLGELLNLRGGSEIELERPADLKVILKIGNNSWAECGLKIEGDRLLLDVREIISLSSVSSEKVLAACFIKSQPQCGTRVSRLKNKDQQLLNL